MSAEVEVGTELLFSSDMNETVLERLAHLEGKLKEMEEENKSLSLRIADLSHRLWKPPENLVCTSLKETKKKRGFTQVCRLLVFSWLSPSTSRKRQFDFANGGVRRKPERSIHRVARSHGKHFQWKNSSVFGVLARLRLGLKAEDVCDRTGLAPSTFSKMFATWVGFWHWSCLFCFHGQVERSLMWPLYRALRSTRQHGWSLIAWRCKCSDQPVFYNNPWHTHSTRAATHWTCLLGYLRVDWSHFCHTQHMTKKPWAVEYRHQALHTHHTFIEGHRRLCRERSFFQDFHIPHVILIVGTVELSCDQGRVETLSLSLSLSLSFSKINK